MSRVVHISDLHFGKDRADLADPLIDTIGKLAPDVVAISGDLTQRARVAQFAEAREFIDRVPAPVLVVPGNHDTPLDNLFVRLLFPWRRYRRAINPDLEPRFMSNGLAVIGINTSDPYAWQRGRLSLRRVRRACAALDAATAASVRIAVLHHPLEQAEGSGKRPTLGADAALEDMSGCGIDVVLSGHLHSRISVPFRAAPGLLFVQAGTCLSTRVRDEPNTFNVLDFGAGRVEVTAWGAEGTTFAAIECSAFEKTGEVWQRRA